MAGAVLVPPAWERSGRLLPSLPSVLSRGSCKCPGSDKSQPVSEPQTPQLSTALGSISSHIVQVVHRPRAGFGRDREDGYLPTSAFRAV